LNAIAFRSLLPFGLFVAAILIYYAVAPKFRFAVLLGLSLGYYGLSSWESLLFVIPLIGLNYLAARVIGAASPAMKRRYLIAIIAIDIAAWMFFKIPREGAPAAPLGISFFSFALIGFQADVFRRKAAAPARVLDLGFFVLWAPKVSQGPIERYDQFISQKERCLDFSNRRMTSGFRLILFGLFKKFVIADRLGPFVAYVFDQSVPFGGFVYFLATVFFAFQIYADFSGYTDIARGVSRLFGYELSFNFRRPYLAKSIREFWKRWHISLSSWLRDYIYLPVAYRISHRLKDESYFGVKSDQWIYIGATGFAFFICGLWHGISAGFVLWGLLFALFLIVSNLTRKNRIRRAFRRILPGWFLGPFQTLSTFFLVCAAWIMFRASTPAAAWMMISRIPAGIFRFVGDIAGIVASHENPEAVLKPLLMGQPRSEFLLAVLGILWLIGVDILLERWKISRKIDLWPAALRWGVYYATIAGILFFGASHAGQTFIYVQF